jgi:hypothetical protein
VADAYLRLRYDDLIAHPRRSLEAIVAMAGGPKADLPLIGERTIDFRATHSLCGNPDRLRTGPVELRLDDEWTRELSSADRLLIASLTWPFLLRYGCHSTP